ncbi:MAG: hypothetical protein Kow0047_16700 [Anaerolineae bacterium]
MRFGATSYVYPADLVTNAQHLSHLVEDMELVLFDVPGFGSNIPDEATVARLRTVAQRHGLTYTVHLPQNLEGMQPGDRLPPSLILARRVIDCTRALAPWAYVVHLDGSEIEDDRTPSTLRSWRARAARSLEVIITWVGDASLVCLENVERWPPEAFDPLVDELGLGRCIDVGHLWQQGRDPAGYLDRWLQRARVVHLHGAANGEDHQSLAVMPLDQLAPVAARLAGGFDGVVTLEVFSHEELRTSLLAWRRTLEALGGG